jgi:predicted nicotinamide N-methyase
LDLLLKKYLQGIESGIVYESLTSSCTGLSVWSAALALSEFISHHKEIFEGKRILEMGAGLGLAGLVAAATCAPLQVILTDYHDRVLDLLTENVLISKFDLHPID